MKSLGCDLAKSFRVRGDGEICDGGLDNLRTSESKDLRVGVSVVMAMEKFTMMDLI